ncbi:fungal-specific transcription factor domain-containing protein [Melanogaster broomeanus]|nr:fungal-specific transcription factor domain-containing protein [Melanogaster broomeanus]
MPPTPKSPQARRTGAPKAKGAVRAKSGCYTCRIRRKKCDEQMNIEGSCSTCVRLRLQCLGFGAKRPEWLRENRNVVDLRDKIKTFLASQGMIKGHSGSGPRSAEQEPQILALSSDYPSPSTSPHTPTLSISSNHEERSSSTYPLRGGQYSDSHDRLPAMLELSPDSPLERSGYSEVLLPAVSYSSTPVIHSLDSWPHSYALQRPHTSGFSRHYNAPFPDVEDNTADVSSAYLIVPEPVANSYSFPGLDQRQNSALDYYMKHVLRMQYLHASDSLDDIIWNLIHTSDTAREAVCLLAGLHRKNTQRDRLGLFEPEDVEAMGRMQVLQFKNPLTEGDALAGLSLVSYFLFSGGKGQWQTFLDAACKFSLSFLQDLRWGGPRAFLLRCTESIRFIIKTSMWFDVLASATLVREPRFLDIIRELYAPQTAFFDEEPALPPTEYSMMSVMGCENHIVLALAEIASLASWKDTHVRAGDLSIPELVRRSQKIGTILKKPSSYALDGCMDAMERQRAHQRRLTSEVFRASAHVYLNSVISGDFPQCPEIIEAVNDTVLRLKEAEDGHTGRAVVRSVVFSICICGCLTENPEHQQYFLKRLQEQHTVGNSQQVSSLIREVWRRRDRGSVDWRQVMREAEMLLV